MQEWVEGAKNMRPNGLAKLVFSAIQSAFTQCQGTPDFTEVDTQLVHLLAACARVAMDENAATEEIQWNTADAILSRLVNRFVRTLDRLVEAGQLTQDGRINSFKLPDWYLEA